MGNRHPHGHAAKRRRIRLAMDGTIPGLDRVGAFKQCGATSP